MHNSVTSETVEQKIGVIQGSICRSLFYENNSSDMNFLLNDDEKNFYADDTCLVFKGHDHDVLANHMNTILAKVLEWCKFNKLALNPSKSVYMLVTGKLSYS